MQENEPLPELELIPPEIPRTLNQTRRYAGHRFLAGEGKRPARVMFLATAGLEEEHQDHIKNRGYGPPIKDVPRYLKGASGQVLQNLTGACGLNLEENYYTALIKWLPPKAKRLKPTKEMVAAALPLLMWEIEQVDPDIIVCLGKPAFDALYPVRYKLSDIAGGWFQQDIQGRMRRLYPMECVTKLATKPEFTERFRLDLREVRRMMDEIDGLWVEPYPEHYRTVTNRVELESLVAEIESENGRILSVDCEWHGPNHVDGQLRSLQICWKPGYAAYIRFMDDQLNYAFDIPYAEAGAILSRYLDRPDVKYVGHHISADLPWMHHVLGLEWYEKVHLDTEFAQQCVDEHGELGLERMCMTYTTLGRWDLELTEWCKKNGKLVEDGYGLIPDSILIPYSQKDVDGPMRAYPYIEKRLKNEYQGEAWRYYSTLFNAFVTDIFTSFALDGLPVNIERANQLRDLYQYVRRELHREFGDRIVDEAERLLRARLMAWDVIEGDALYRKLYDLVGSGDPDGAGRLLWGTLPTDLHPQFTALWKHYLSAPEFKITSPAHVRSWLFEVKRYTPVKSTNQKEKGLPSMPWAKVLELPPERQREFTPSTDGQTLEILGTTHEDPVLQKLLEFKAINQVCTQFLGEPTRDEDTGEVIKEKGLMYYVAGDGCIHAMTSSTETGRPRLTKIGYFYLHGRGR